MMAFVCFRFGMAFIVSAMADEGKLICIQIFVLAYAADPGRVCQIRFAAMGAYNRDRSIAQHEPIKAIRYRASDAETNESAAENPENRVQDDKSNDGNQPIYRLSKLIPMFRLERLACLHIIYESTV